jgi:hypothetical protein
MTLVPPLRPQPVSKRTGKRYASGSTQRRGGWEPEDCTGCGKRVTSSKGPAAIFVRPANGPAESWHVYCWLKWFGESVRVEVSVGRASG